MEQGTWSLEAAAEEGQLILMAERLEEARLGARVLNVKLHWWLKMLLGTVAEEAAEIGITPLGAKVTKE